MKTQHNVIRNFGAIAALFLAGCGTNTTTPEPVTPTPASQTLQELFTKNAEPVTKPSTDTARLEIPLRPQGPTTPTVVVPPPPTQQGLQKSTAKSEYSPATDQQAGSGAIRETQPSNLVPTQAASAPDAELEDQTQALKTPDELTTLVSNAKRLLQQTDDISVITWRAERGHIESQLALGRAYSQGNNVERDPEQARLWLELASMQGDRTAQYELGKMYFTGAGVKQDFFNAREWWIESAINGNDHAQQKLGYLYSEGLGVERDFDKAKGWYTRAANLGNAEAQTLLGSLYHEGNRIPQDYDEAFKWYQLAANQGHPHAQYTLGVLYHDGLGTETDKIKCAAWIAVAAANDYPDELNAAQECRKNLDEISLQTVDQLTDDWKSRFLPVQQSY